VYLEITPGTAPAQLLGTSVKLTIAVKSTQQAVLTVPVTALSVGADGSSRVQVQRPGNQTQYVSVTPGLAAKGLVEVRAGNDLAAGDLVIVGQRGDSASTASAGSGTGAGSTSGGTSGGTSSGSTGTSGGRAPPAGSTGKSGGSGGATGGSSVGTTP